MKMRRWLVTGCLGLALVFAGYKVEAQLQTGGPNLVQTLSAWALYVPQVILNTISQTYYGLVWSSDTAAGVAAWNLGYGTSLTAPTVPTEQQLLGNGQGSSGPATALLQIDASGWLSLKSSYLYNNSGSLPTLSGCGTASGGVEGSDQAGDLSLGTSPTSNCTVKFANPPAQKPLCFCNDATNPTEGCAVNVTSTSSFFMEPSVKGNSGADVFQTGDELDWFCAARQ